MATAAPPTMGGNGKDADLSTAAKNNAASAASSKTKQREKKIVGGFSFINCKCDSIYHKLQMLLFVSRAK